MSLRKSAQHVSVAEYLAGEKDSPVRHEYVHGQVYAMAGASDRHNLIAGTVYSRLLDHTARGPCQTFVSDMKVMVDSSLYYYPDVVVSCDPPGGDPYFRTQPVLIIEVTSPNTHRTDYQEKLAAYKRIPSLREYVLIAQDQVLVEIFRRDAGDRWTVEELTEPDQQLRFESVGLSMSLADVYRNAPLAEI